MADSASGGKSKEAGKANKKIRKGNKGRIQSCSAQ
jgi:hypothetical protein